MAVSASHKVVRVPDDELVKLLLDVAATEAGSIVSAITIRFANGEKLVTKRDEFDSDEQLNFFKSSRSIVIASASLLGPQKRDLAVINRHLGEEGKSELFDELTILPGDQHQQISIGTLAKLSATFLTAAEKLTSRYSLPPLEPDAKARDEAREIATSKMEVVAASLSETLEDQLKRLAESYSLRVAEVERTSAERERDFEARSAEEHKKLETLRSELEARRKEIDDRESRHARRADREKLLEAIQNEQFLAVSSHTRKRRTAVLAGYGILILVVGGLLIEALVRQPVSGVSPYFAIGRQSVLTIALITTAGFLLKWLHSFAYKSATEDFKLKQMQLDVQRANWLIELYFEAAESGEGSAFPEELMERLSRSLFTSSEAASESAGPTDALATLLGSAARARFGIPGGEVEFEKKECKSLGKSRGE